MAALSKNYQITITISSETTLSYLMAVNEKDIKARIRILLKFLHRAFNTPIRLKITGVSTKEEE